MSNAELFKKVFGIYAEEFWAYPREKMLDWLTSDIPNLDVGDTISREVAIEAVLELDAKHRVSWKDAVIDMLDALPSAQPEQKTGQWYDVGSLSCRCSECGCKSPKEYLFCPNCGKRMDGGKAEYGDGTIHCGAEMEK